MAVVTKPGVVFKGFTYELLSILDSLVWFDRKPLKGQPVNLVITSANDSQHKAGSKHYENLAVDVRSRSFADLVTKQAFAEALKQELGENFTVLLEGVGTPNEHFHIQHRRKQ